MPAEPEESLNAPRESSGGPARVVARSLLCISGQLPRGPRNPAAYCLSMRGYSQDKDAYLKRLRRIEGQVRGLQRMIDEDKYCIDILTQVSAVTKALQAVALGLLEEHLGHCVAQAVADGDDSAAEKVREASEAIARLVRS